MSEPSFDPSCIPQEVIDAVRTIEQWHHHHGVAHWALFGICSRNNEVDRLKLKDIARAWHREATQYMRQVEEARTKGTEHQGMLARSITLNGCANAIEKALE